MRVNDQPLDREVLRHFQGMRDDLGGFMEKWISLEQLMHEHDLQFAGNTDDVHWYMTCQHVMSSMDALIDIVKNAEQPVPIHWLRWRRETAAQLDSWLATLEMVLEQS